MIARWARQSIRFRWFVVAFWCLCAVAGIAAFTTLSPLLSNSFEVPGTDSYRVERLLAQRFQQRPDGSFELLVQGNARDTTALLAEADDGALRVVRALPVSARPMLRSVEPLSPSVIVAAVSTNLTEISAKKYVDHAAAAARAASGPGRITVTGPAAVEDALNGPIKHDLEAGEIAFGVPAALIVLALMFGSLACLLPFVFTVCVLPSSIGLIWIAAHGMILSTYITNLVVAVGLGVSVDYSLLLYSRFREEQARAPAGEHVTEAVVRTMQTAGRSVVFSGSAVAIGLALLMLIPLPFIRGFGFAGLVIPIVSVMCSLSLAPVLLAFAAPRLDRVRFVSRRRLQRRQTVREDDGWLRVARHIMSRPWRYAIGSVVLLLALAAPILQLELTPAQEAGFPTRAPAIHALRTITRIGGEGVFAPIEVVVDTGSAQAARSDRVRAAAERLRRAMARDSATSGAQILTGNSGIDVSGRYLRLRAFGTRQYGTETIQRLVARIRTKYIPVARFPASTTVLVGGTPALGVDFDHVAYSWFKWLIVAVLIATFILLVRAFRSLLLPVKAIVLNLLTIAASYGAMVLAFRHGWGAWAGLAHVPQIESWIPIFMFAMLFGLSMDYEVFLVTRMREEWDARHNNRDAVAYGLAHTGRLVTAAGAIMVVAFSGLCLGRFANIQQFGFGLAVSVAIDVTVVRCILLPAVMRLFGRWNWWLPAWMARIVRVTPSPLRGRNPRTTR